MFWWFFPLSKYQKSCPISEFHIALENLRSYLLTYTPCTLLLSLNGILELTKQFFKNYFSKKYRRSTCIPLDWKTLNNKISDKWSNLLLLQDWELKCWIDAYSWKMFFSINDISISSDLRDSPFKLLCRICVSLETSFKIRTLSLSICEK